MFLWLDGRHFYPLSHLASLSTEFFFLKTGFLCLAMAVLELTLIDQAALELRDLPVSAALLTFTVSLTILLTSCTLQFVYYLRVLNFLCRKISNLFLSFQFLYFFCSSLTTLYRPARTTLKIRDKSRGIKLLKSIVNTNIRFGVNRFLTKVLFDNQKMLLTISSLFPIKG